MEGRNLGRRNHRVNPYLPPRPKKCVSGYGIFIQEYWTRHNPGGGAQAVNGFRNASEAWKDMTAAQKQVYIDRAAPQRAVYAAEMATWKAQRKGLQRPTSAYGLFLKEEWQRERAAGNRRTVAEMSLHASGLWRNMEPLAKRKYKDLQTAQTIRYREEMDKVRGGQRMEVNWRDDVGLPEAPLPEDDQDDDEDFDDEDFDVEDFDADDF